jgi:hypothetical protein
MIGLDAKTYYGAAGATATTELTIVREVNMNEARDDAVSGYRDSDTKSHDVGLNDVTVSLVLKNKTSDAGYRAIMDAYDARTPIALLIVDSANGEGLDADFVIISRSQAQPIDGVIEWSYELAVNTDLREPAWQEAD